jgi:hypothetical protein
MKMKDEINTNAARKIKRIAEVVARHTIACDRDAGYNPLGKNKRNN